jgi:hypothetical protein
MDSFSLCAVLAPSPRYSLQAGCFPIGVWHLNNRRRNDLEIHGHNGAPIPERRPRDPESKCLAIERCELNGIALAAIFHVFGFCGFRCVQEFERRCPKFRTPTSARLHAALARDPICCEKKSAHGLGCGTRTACVRAWRKVVVMIYTQAAGVFDPLFWLPHEA